MNPSRPSAPRALHDSGISIWLDDLSRRLLDDGALERHVAVHAVSGVTSNPTIFAAALKDFERYAPRVEALQAQGVRDPRALFFALALDDVIDGAALLRPIHEASAGRDGFVSFELTPDVAHDTTATVRQAVEVRERVDASNLMIKVPATDAGMDSIEELTFRGISVNVTLLFSARRHEAAATAYLRGLQRRLATGRSLHGIASVASVFVSRIDARLASVLGPDAPGRSVAIANAYSIHAQARAIFSGPAWTRLAAAGAAWQRPLWASTATKDPGLPDVLYVEGLAIPGSIITVPEPTLLAFADHGHPNPVRPDERQARETLRDLARRGPDIEEIGDALLVSGLESFDLGYRDAIERLSADMPVAVASHDL